MRLRQMMMKRNLNLENTPPASISTLSKASSDRDGNTDSLPTTESSTIRVIQPLQRFPSSTINNESFMRIDDWPKQPTVAFDEQSMCYSSRLRDWIRGHCLASAIAIVVAILLITAITLAVVLPLTLPYNPNSITFMNITTAPNSTSSQQPTTSTDAFNPGYWTDVSMQMFELNSTRGLQAMRPDTRNPGDYILTGDDRIVLLSSCAQLTTRRSLWHGSEIAHCTQNNVTEIEHELNLRSCSRCDVFDVLEDCRHNSSLCSDSSFAFCCRNCSSKYSASVCSLRGSPVADYDTDLLDGRFIYRNQSSYSFLFSTKYQNGGELCTLQQQLMKFEGGQVSQANLPSSNCQIDDVALDQIESSAITTVSVMHNTWKALLTTSGRILISNLNGTQYSIDGVENRSAKLLFHPDSNQSALLVDISMVTSTFSVIRIDERDIQVLVPRKSSISIPGTFMDAFLDNGELVIWNVKGNAVVVARVRFTWTY